MHVLRVVLLHIKHIHPDWSSATSQDGACRALSGLVGLPGVFMQTYSRRNRQSCAVISGPMRRSRIYTKIMLSCRKIKYNQIPILPRKNR